MKRLLTYLGQYRLFAVLAPLFKCLEACFELFVPLVVARMIDVGIANSDSGYIMKMGALLILLGLIGLSCSITAQWFSADVAVRVGTGLRKDLLSHMLGLGYADIDGVGTSTLLTRMTSDINQVQTGVNMFLRLFMRSPFIVFGAVIMAFTVDVRGALVFAVTVPLLAIVVFGILLGSVPLYRRVQSQLDRVMLLTRENLLGVRVVRAFGMEEREKKSFHEANDLLRSLQIFVGKISALLNPVTVVIVNLAIVVLLYTGAHEVELGILTQGKVVALVNYMSQILVELVKLANLIILISKAAASMNRVDAVFGMKNPIEKTRGKGMQDIFPEDDREVRPGAFVWSEVTAVPEEEPAVVFSHVSFSYPGAKGESLKDISFEARRGETIGIIGGTGSGKSTLINLIPRFYDVSSGSVIVNGIDVRDWDAKLLRGLIGLVPQKAVLFAGTIRDNLKWGSREASDEALLRAMSVAQASDILTKKKEGLDFELEQGGTNLSGGQRQRLTIARAVARDPEILILDDSASALDFATDAALRHALRTETAGMTVFLISQRAASVKAADRILVLEDGAAAGFGTHAELLRSCAVYREICLSQMSEEEVQRSEEA
ncbi:MAG: ABC transporter ATP-binding protein [Eubacteriales bacterium]|nr:ABC transporter ATP-binding protein [Eubacteriales bacterium]